MRVVSIALALSLAALPVSAAGLQRLWSLKAGPLPPSLANRRVAEPYSKPAAWFGEGFKPVHTSRFAVSRSPGSTAIAVYPKDWRHGMPPEAYAFPVLDLQRRTVIWPELPYGPAFADKDGTPDLVYYDDAGGQAGICLEQGTRDVAMRRYPTWFLQAHYLHWDLRTGTVDWSAPYTGDHEHHGPTNLGVDPTGRYFYFCQYSYRRVDPDDVNKDVATGLTFRRLDLMARTVDAWQRTITLPKRQQATLLGSLDIRPSQDFSRFVVAEYCEPSHGTVVPPPQGWVVDVVGETPVSFEIPRLAYGLVFDRAGRYLLIGSHSEGKLFRYDLGRRRRDRVVPSQAGIHNLALSADNRTLYVFTRHVIEQRTWPDMRLVRHYSPGNLAPGQRVFDPEGPIAMPDGLTACLNDTDSQGFSTRKGAYVIRL
jgi:hypothetical protein